MASKVKSITENLNIEKPVAGKQIERAPQPAITAPTGGGTIDAEARTAITSILTLLRNLNLSK